MASNNSTSTNESQADNSNPTTSAQDDVRSGDLPSAAIDFATRLFEGARAGDVALFEQVLNYQNSVKNLRNDKGDTFVMLAAYHGQLPLLRLLLSHNADPNILNDRKQSPLAGAIFKGEKAVVEALADAGADWDVGEPSAREAVKIFRQEEVWGEKMGKRVVNGHIGGGPGGDEEGQGI